MKPKTLRLRARGTAMVTDYEAMDAGVKRFIGWKLNPSLGEAGGFESNDSITEKPARAEYLMALASGDLWPADKDTAEAASVDFDPTFGAGRKVAKKDGDS